MGGGVSPAAAPADEARPLAIVAPEAFHPALAEFVAFKRGARPTKLHALERILREGRGADDPEKLKRFLYDAWRRDKIGYVLLVGDVDVLPVRYMVLDRITPAAFDYAFYPSDLYYSDLAKADGAFEDWNARKESFHAGYYGEVRGEKNKKEPINYDEIDYLPDIAVGRWPVSATEEVRRVAAATMARERALKDGSSGAERRAAFVAVGGWVDSRDLLDRLAGRLGPTWAVEKRYYTDGRRPAARPPDREGLLALLNGGLDLLVHAGHGQPDAWEQCFGVRDLPRLTNDAARPVILSAGCSTAYFAPLPPYGAYVDVDGREHAGTDHGEVFAAPPPPPAPYQRGRFNPTGLGEQLLKRERGGAIAYIGCNTGSQPCGLTLAEGFVEALAEASAPRVGDCWTSAIRFYHRREKLPELRPTDGWYPPSVFFQGMKFMLFGDPSLPFPAAPAAR